MTQSVRFSGVKDGKPVSFVRHDLGICREPDAGGEMADFYVSEFRDDAGALIARSGIDPRLVAIGMTREKEDIAVLEAVGIFDIDIAT